MTVLLTVDTNDPHTTYARASFAQVGRLPRPPAAISVGRAETGAAPFHAASDRW